MDIEGHFENTDGFMLTCSITATLYEWSVIREALSQAKYHGVTSDFRDKIDSLTNKATDRIR